MHSGTSHRRLHRASQNYCSERAVGGRYPPSRSGKDQWLRHLPLTNLRQVLQTASLGHLLEGQRALEGLIAGKVPFGRGLPGQLEREIGTGKDGKEALFRARRSFWALFSRSERVEGALCGTERRKRRQKWDKRTKNLASARAKREEVRCRNRVPDE